MELDEEVRKHLAVLGESEVSWPITSEKKVSRKGAGYGGDWRVWEDLLWMEQEVATQLGFTAPTWNMTEMGDVHAYLKEFCGDGFEGCVAQGCDNDSISDTV